MKNLIDSAKVEGYAKFLGSIDTVLTDCDGVLWIENDVIEGAVEAMNGLVKNGKKVYYVTNNSTKTRVQLCQKLKSLGFNATEDSVIASAKLVSQYLKSHLPPCKSVYVLGSPALSHELELEGIKNFGIGPDVLEKSLLETVRETKLDANVGGVVAAFDEHISYVKLMKAASYLNDPNCLFVASNTDDRYPAPTNLVIPGTGTIVRAVETCSLRKPVVVGKPSTHIGSVLQSQGVDPTRTLMIGDRCDTDILFAKRCGYIGLLVLSGVHTLEDVERFKNSQEEEGQLSVPDYYTNSVRDIIQLLNKNC